MALEGGTTVHMAQPAEVYKVSFPALVLSEPLSPSCRVHYKGEVAVACAASGLMATIKFKKDGGVKGAIERHAPGEY